MGQLGHGVTSNCSIPTKIEALKMHTFMQVSACRSTTAVLNSNGQVFWWGEAPIDAAFFSVGEILGSDLPPNFSATPTQVQVSDKITQVSCGFKYLAFSTRTLSFYHFDTL